MGKPNKDKNVAKTGNNNDDVPDFFKRFFNDLKKSSNSKQLMAGAMGGVVSGYLAAKFGKLAAIAVGGSMLVIQVMFYLFCLSLIYDFYHRQIDSTIQWIY